MVYGDLVRKTGVSPADVDIFNSVSGDGANLRIRGKLHYGCNVRSDGASW